jgi:hypothetical protein
MNCKHCEKPFSCGCQKATANDGAVVHKTCLTTYQNKISGVVAKSDKLTQNIKKAYSNITRK